MSQIYPSGGGSASDTIKVEGQGTSYFNNATDCKVGIGITNPTNALQVEGIGITNPTNALQVEGTGIAITRSGYGNKWEIGKDNYCNGLYFYENGSPGAYRVAFATGGNVGIGTTDPKGLLQLKNSYVVAPAPTGTAATDTQNINDAVGAVSASQVGGTVCLQAGTYVVNSTISLPRGLNLIGAGADRTTIKIDKSNGAAPVLDTYYNPPTEPESTQFVVIKNLKIDSEQTRTHTGIRVKHSHFCSVENVEIMNMDYGMFVTYDFNKFSNFFIQNCNIGILLGDTADANYGWSSGNYFSSGQISNCINYGIRCAYAHNNWFHGITIECNTDENFVAGISLETNAGGIAILGGHNFINGCYIEGNHGDQVRIDSVGNRLVGNWIYYTAPDTGIHWVSGSGASDGNTLQGNTIWDGSAHYSDVMLRSVGIGTTSPNAAALLQIDSTTKGFLPPRMTTTQRNNISSPPEGLVIYNTTTHTLQFYNGSNWYDS
jgi:hypothetical protein